MKTIDGIVTNYPTLRAEIKRELSLREWTYADLAAKTGDTPYTIFSRLWQDFADLLKWHIK